MTDASTVLTTPPPALDTVQAAPGDHVDHALRLAPAGRLYMTSELRAATGLRRTHLDYYLREGLVVPTARTESGYLLFDDAELATLRTIIADRRAGVPLREIRRRLGRERRETEG